MTRTKKIHIFIFIITAIGVFLPFSVCHALPQERDFSLRNRLIFQKGNTAGKSVSETAENLGKSELDVTIESVYELIKTFPKKTDVPIFNAWFLDPYSDTLSALTLKETISKDPILGKYIRINAIEDKDIDFTKLDDGLDIIFVYVKNNEDEKYKEAGVGKRLSEWYSDKIIELSPDNNTDLSVLLGFKEKLLMHKAKEEALLNKALDSFIEEDGGVSSSIHILSEEEIGDFVPALEKKGVRVYLLTKEQLADALIKIGAGEKDRAYILKNFISSTRGSDKIFMLEAYYDWLNLLDADLVAQWARHHLLRLDHPKAPVRTAEEQIPLDNVINALEAKVRDAAILLRSMEHAGTLFDPATSLGLIAHILDELEGEKYIEKNLRERFYKDFDLIKEKDGSAVVKLRGYYLPLIPKGRDPEFDAEKIKIIKDYVITLYERLKVFKSGFENIKKEIKTEGAEEFVKALDMSLEKGLAIFQNRINAVNGMVEKEPFDINKLIDSKDEETKHRQGDLLSKYPNRKKKGYIKIGFKKKTVPEVLANRDMVFAVLVNILQNNEQLGKKLKITEETINIRRVKDRVVIKIRDNGRGFHESMLTNITRKSDGWHKVAFGLGISFRYDGTGLGLEQSALEIALNGGTFEVFSKTDEGSEFIITLPTKDSFTPEDNAFRKSPKLRKNVLNNL